jgi:hypothetical protein
MYKRGTLEERFWDKVEKSDGCWNWTASCNGPGYGQIRPGGCGNQLLAHRVSWEIHHGPIPDGLCVLHDCDNPPCVNPAHLFLGTKGDNTRDMHAKGRNPDLRGELGPLAKLTEKQVLEIKMYLAQGVIHRIVAKHFGVGKTAIQKINAGVRWKHLSQGD